MSISILHLTDLHAGPGEFRDEDMKTQVPSAERQKALARMTAYLRALPKVPDYAVITGDLTIAGNPKGFEKVRQWLDECINEGLLPPAERILVVPGNHDVTWGVPEGEGWNKERFGPFFNAVAHRFPHAHLPGCDPGLDAKQPQFKGDDWESLGGIKPVLKDGAAVLERSWPFIIDRKRELLFFAFNSAHACGVYLPEDEAIVRPLDALSTLYPGDVAARLKEARDAYRKSLIVDAGLITDEQLQYFAELMGRIRDELPTLYPRLTKIALLHHHVSHLWRQQMEVKKFEAVIDASQLKQYLVEFDFDFVLHGHKHTNHVAVDGSIIPITSKGHSPLCIASGGTVGGNPRVGDQQGFKLLELEEERGPRRAAKILEVPLVDTADPRTVIQREAKLFMVPVSERIPVIHQLPSLKKSLDHALIRQTAPELLDHKAVIMSAAQFQMPAANPDLVGTSSRYEFHAMLEDSATRSFYDVILAPSRLSFIYRARVYWMLTDVAALAEKVGRPTKIILLIGDLEQTQFETVQRKGEISTSIEKLKRWFQPALDSRLLEIRVHEFTEPEIELIASDVAAGRTPEWN
jgi:3',5'-cyclic AMP phosphodiesterase CpdA